MCDAIGRALGVRRHEALGLGEDVLQPVREFDQVVKREAEVAAADQDRAHPAVARVAHGVHGDALDPLHGSSVSLTE
jgi:hypothetical protein